MKEAAQIVATLFISREQAHREHLKTTSYAQHMALGDFYESIVNLADTFAETAQGLYGILTIPYEQPIKGDIASVLEQHAANIEDCRECFKESAEAALLNIIDEISALYSQTLYKLKVLK